MTIGFHNLLRHILYSFIGRTRFELFAASMNRDIAASASSARDVLKLHQALRFFQRFVVVDNLCLVSLDHGHLLQLPVGLGSYVLADLDYLILQHCELLYQNRASER